ncbi:MAG: DUF6356 family protein [Sphingomonas sp.]|jgi:hypothetical protein
MIRRLFLDHPASVGEGYAEHFGVAAGFGAAMMLGGAGALLHAIFPFLCKSTGSDTITRLHATLVAKRAAKREAVGQMASVEYII